MLPELKIGNLVAKYPIIQGGMGVGISLSSLAGAVAKAGGIGVISAAQPGWRDPEFARDPLSANLRALAFHIRRAKEISNGGIIGVNGKNHVIDRCASRGTMNGLDAMGGVAGLNEGRITDCTLSGSMGSATQDYIGGIAGLNVGGSTAGTIENCTAGKNCTVTGRTAVGGIVGFNLSGGRVQNCTGSANVRNQWPWVAKLI